METLFLAQTKDTTEETTTGDWTEEPESKQTAKWTCCCWCHSRCPTSNVTRQQTTRNTRAIVGMYDEWKVLKASDTRFGTTGIKSTTDAVRLGIHGE